MKWCFGGTLMPKSMRNEIVIYCYPATHTFKGIYLLAVVRAATPFWKHLPFKLIKHDITLHQKCTKYTAWPTNLDTEQPTNHMMNPTCYPQTSFVQLLQMFTRDICKTVCFIERLLNEVKCSVLCISLYICIQSGEQWKGKYFQWKNNICRLTEGINDIFSVLMVLLMASFS